MSRIIFELQDKKPTKMLIHGLHQFNAGHEDDTKKMTSDME